MENTKKQATKIISVSNQKGGVGKTTTAINIAAALTRLNQKVLLIDLDPQGNATTGLGINKGELKTTIYDSIILNTNIYEAVVETKYNNLFCVPSNINLAGAENELIEIENSQYRLKETIAPLNSFDYIFIDCPPSLGNLTVNALTAAKSILIPLQCEYYALEGLTLLLETIDRVKESLNPSLSLEGIVLTMYDMRTNLSNNVIKEVKDYFKDKVYATVIPRNIKLAEAPSYGEPIIFYAPESTGAKMYTELAKEVITNGEKNRTW